MTAWQKFLKECTPSKKTRDQFQEFFGRTIADSLPLKKFKVTIALKHRAGIAFTVMARCKEEAEIIARNKPECNEFMQESPFIEVTDVFA